MKLYRNLLLGASALMCAASFTACEEEATLDGAKSVYIEMSPSEYTLRIGDTIPVNVSVTNESGKTIATSVKWTVDDESVAKVLGDSVIVAVPGGQGKMTNLRATLPNGRYGIAKVSVVNNLTKGIAVLDTLGVVQKYQCSYNIGHDSAVFTVLPKEVLMDFTPTYKIEGEGLAEFAEQPMYINREAGTVSIHYSAARKQGVGKISVSLGNAGSDYTGSIEIRMDPPICMVSFWGPDYATKYGLGASRPPVTHNPDFAADSYERMMDINQVDTCRVAVNVTTADSIDIVEAMKCYRWEAMEGSSVLVSGMYSEMVPNHGFDAVFIVRSGVVTGETMFRMVTPTDTLFATYRVFNYKDDYPVEEITCDPMSVSIASGEVFMLTTGVKPASSFGFHKPKVVPENPELVSVGDYISNQVPLTGLKPGKTNLILTANGKTLTVPIEVKEAVKNIFWDGARTNKIFAGQTVQWNVRVETPSGAPNPYPLSFISSDENVAIGAVPEGVNTYGVVKGIGVGEATITAKVLNITSDKQTISVVKAPTAADVPTAAYDEIGVMDEDGNLVIDFIPGRNSEVAYSQVLLSIAGVSGDTAQVGEGSTLTLNGAVAKVVSGSLTLTPGTDSDLLINGSIVIEVPGNGSVTWTFTNLPAGDWR